MANNVRVNLFEVAHAPQTQKLSDTLVAFSQLPIEQRYRGDIRLEQVIQFPADNVLPYEQFHLEFAKERQIGPGRMSRTAAISNVGLQRDELFGEETAALYLPSKKWLLVLNNLYGVGPSRMADYFNALDPGNDALYLDYMIQPMIDQHTLARMRKVQRFSEIEITASVGAFDKLDDKVAESVLDAAKGVKAHRLTLKLHANEKRKSGASLTPSAVRHLVDKLLTRSEDIDKLAIKGDDEALQNRDSVINLIEHRVHTKFRASELQVDNHRYTHGSKMDLLRRACRGWLTSLA